MKSETAPNPQARLASEIAIARSLHEAGALPSQILEEMRRIGVQGVLPLVFIGREVWGLGIAVFKDAVGIDGHANVTDPDAFDRYIAAAIAKRDGGDL